ncbi:hypothetical protein [Apibacter adventoris]|nr:hypothetical protein [Apibacter adventoris]
MGIQLPTLYGRTGNLGVFLGRNSLILGSSFISDGVFHWSDKIYNRLFY